jgi:hypothetical protein
MGIFDFLFGTKKNKLGSLIPKGQIIPDSSTDLEGVFANLTPSEKNIPGSSGEFGLVETNPVPLEGVFISYVWIPLLRYRFISDTGFTIYLPVESDRIGSGDDQFGGPTDSYQLFDIDGKKLAKIYINGYQSFTSVKAPSGFFLSTHIDQSLDAEKVLNNFKNLSKEEKQNLDKQLFNNLF